MCHVHFHEKNGRSSFRSQADNFLRVDSEMFGPPVEAGMKQFGEGTCVVIPYQAALSFLRALDCRIPRKFANMTQLSYSLCSPSVRRPSLAF
jgi:hypothetical protein